jgi:hypothetical protein
MIVCYVFVHARNRVFLLVAAKLYTLHVDLDLKKKNYAIY